MAGALEWILDRRKHRFGGMAGGEAALAALFKRFYEKGPPDPVLGPVFAGMDPTTAEHVAASRHRSAGVRAELYRRGRSHAE